MTHCFSKGTGVEITRVELEAAFAAALGIPSDHLVNEYGMAELGSQFYNDGLLAHHEGRALHPSVRLILTDAEMPEMDGYVLAKNVKSDRRFDGIPVVMHSSLSSQANRNMGLQSGVDTYVPKFDAHALAETLRPLLS
jgi:two-component system chemotaxis response regulator CheV